MTAEMLLQVVELLPGPALVVGLGGEVLVANDRAGRWVGPGRDPLTGRPLAGLVADPPERVAGFLEECRRAGRKVAGTLTPTRASGAGGACRVEGISLQPRPDGGEPAPVVVHVVAGDLDVADRGAGGSGGTLETLREEVRRRDALLDRLAHDLRNPVAALSGALHLVRRATAPEDVAWAEEAMERQLKHLVRQLDDLLDLTRIARGRIELDRRRLDAAAVARAAAAAARPLVDEHGHRLILSAPPGELAVDADPARLEQILVALLGHAARSAERGSSLRLSLGRERESIAFCVRDRDEAPHPATPPAVPGPPAADADQEGIGLILARRLAEMHGGSASFRRASTPAEGSEFAVRIPTDAPTGSAPRPADAARAGARILVVDDNVDAANGTARLLQLAGHDVRVAHDGYQALELADAHRPRFILLDIGLPGMDGYEVARRLRADPRHRDATIIAVSGYSEDDYRPPQESGINHHLAKPVDYDALRGLLSRSEPAGD